MSDPEPTEPTEPTAPTDGSAAVRTFPDMWVDPEDDPREALGPTRGERATLAGYLDAYRMTLEMKCAGLDAEQLATRSVPPSTLSLLGLVRHLANVESYWFRLVLEGQSDGSAPYDSADDHDIDFNGAIPVEAVVAEAWSTWHRETSHGRAYLESADLGELVTRDGDDLEVRDVVVHLIEEYARHVGHADLLRECIDGRTGQ